MRLKIASQTRTRQHQPNQIIICPPRREPQRFMQIKVFSKKTKLCVGQAFWNHFYSVFFCWAKRSFASNVSKLTFLQSANFYRLSSDLQIGTFLARVKKISQSFFSNRTFSCYILLEANFVHIISDLSICKFTGCSQKSKITRICLVPYFGSNRKWVNSRAGSSEINSICSDVYALTDKHFILSAIFATSKFSWVLF